MKSQSHPYFHAFETCSMFTFVLRQFCHAVMCKEKTTNQIKLIHAIMLNFIGLMALKGYS